MTRPSLRLLVVGMTLALLATLPGAVPASAASLGSGGRSEPAAAQSVSWLVRQVGDNHLVTGPQERYRVRVVRPGGKGKRWVVRTRAGRPYAALSVDVVHALRRLRPGADLQRDMVRALEPRAVGYVGYRIGVLKGRRVDAVARMVELAATAGIPLRSYADGSLKRTLQAMVRTGRDNLARGRVVDSGWAGDKSNTVTQAAAVQALAATRSRYLPIAARFLAKQACPGGHFRLSMDSPDFTCAGSRRARNRVASTDATASAVLALRVAHRAGVKGLRVPIRRGAAWLVRVQRPGGGMAELGHVNARSTALTALALKATGRRGAAANAAAWLQRHQVDRAMVRSAPRLKRVLGAIAPDSRALRQARAHGVGAAARKQWVRSTAVSAAGLVAILPARRLQVRVGKHRLPGGRVRVAVVGLQPHETFDVRRKGVKVVAGRVGRDGVARGVVRLPGKGRTIRLEATGSRAVRTGSAVIRG